MIFRAKNKRQKLHLPFRIRKWHILGGLGTGACLVICPGDALSYCYEQKTHPSKNQQKQMTRPASVVQVGNTEYGGHPVACPDSPRARRTQGASRISRPPPCVKLQAAALRTGPTQMAAMASTEWRETGYPTTGVRGQPPGRRSTGHLAWSERLAKCWMKPHLSCLNKIDLYTRSKST